MTNDEILAKATPPQLKSFKALCARYEEPEPRELYFDSYGALMCGFKGITIGIEKDGYAHS